VAAPDDIFRKGLGLHQRGKLAEAQALYRQVLAVDPRHFDSLHLLGLSLVQGGDPRRGADLIRQALTIRSDFPEAHYNLGNALLTLGQPAEALASLERALQLNPGDAQYRLEAGNALKELKRSDEAIAQYDQAIRLHPASAEAFNNRGIALKDAGRPAEAVASLDAAIALRPAYAEAHSNRGNALKELGRLDEALACHDTAISLRPDYAEAHYNRANLLGEMKRLDAALAGYDAALRLRPDYAEASHNKSLLLLGAGRLAEGFTLYGSRWNSPSFNGSQLETTVAAWDGRPGAGRLLLWPEQGIGDEIFHASLLSLLPTEGLAVTVAADRRLCPAWLAICCIRRCWMLVSRPSGWPTSSNKSPLSCCCPLRWRHCACMKRPAGRRIRPRPIAGGAMSNRPRAPSGISNYLTAQESHWRPLTTLNYGRRRKPPSKPCGRQRSGSIHWPGKPLSCRRTRQHPPHRIAGY